MNKKTLLYGLAALGILLVIGAFILLQDNKIKLSEGFVVGEQHCEGTVCVTPLSISEDRHNANLLVYDSNSNKTCVQELKDGQLIPLHFYDCRPGNDWNGERGETTGTGFQIDPGFSS